MICNICNKEVEKTRVFMDYGELCEKHYFEKLTKYKLKTLKIPKKLLLCNFENFDLSDTNANLALQYLKDTKASQINEIVLISGKSGRGKSHLAISYLRKYILKLKNPIFINSIDLLLELRRGFDSYESEKEIMSKYKNADLLIIDDLGAEKTTDYVIQCWYSIINYRESNLMATIITSNLSLKEISEKLGNRIASRIGGGKVFNITAEKDFRLIK